jgi:hypothetical protein
VSEGDPRTGASGGPAPAADEFAHIPDRSRRPPLLVVLTVAVAVFLIVRLRHDVSFALSPATPIELGEARTLAGTSLEQLPLNRYVRLQGLPERESAVILDPRGSWEFSQLFRLHGTRGRFFVRRSQDPLPVALAERDRFTGRLLHFSDLSFAGSIGQHFATRVTATHFFRPADLAAALARSTRPVVVRDVAGEPVTLNPSERLTFDVVRPGEYRLELPRARFPDRARAEAAVQAAGGRALETRETEPSWIVRASIPDATRDKVLSALTDQDRAIQFRMARDAVEIALSDLRASAEGFDFGASAPALAGPVAPARIAAIRILTTVQVPPDAVLLIEGEAPRSQLKSVAILVILVVFGTVSLLALRRPA